MLKDGGESGRSFRKQLSEAVSEEEEMTAGKEIQVLPA